MLMRQILSSSLLLGSWLSGDAFSIIGPVRNTRTFAVTSSPACAAAGKKGSHEATLRRVPPDLEGVPIAFVEGTSFIECYADSIAMVNGKEYTIGVPCDYAVAICYYDDDGNLVPLELDDELMDDVFPVAEAIVDEEFGEELVLQRTPQTLTLVGELDDDHLDEMEDMEGDEEDDDEDEEVEVLLSFEHRDIEFNLVRLLDPILLVGTPSPDSPDNRVLLNTEESAEIMPILEDMFLQYHEDPDAMLP